MEYLGHFLGAHISFPSQLVSLRLVINSHVYISHERPFGRGTTLLRGHTNHRYQPLTIWDDPPSINLIPSRELTYPPDKAYLKMIFLFPRWDMLISWRVSIKKSPRCTWRSSSDPLRPPWPRGRSQGDTQWVPRCRQGDIRCRQGTAHIRSLGIIRGKDVTNHNHNRNNNKQQQRRNKQQALQKQATSNKQQLLQKPACTTKTKAIFDLTKHHEPISCISSRSAFRWINTARLSHIMSRWCWLWRTDPCGAIPCMLQWKMDVYLQYYPQTGP